MPVPSGIVASSTSRPAMPFTTSLSVPSPPTATTSDAPPATASRARSIRWPGRSEKSVSPSRPSADARRWSFGQRFPVAPLPEAGLTRKTVLMVGDRDVERDPRHAVDRRAQLVVRDPLELAFDDDVAHGEQAAGFDAAQRADREQRRGLHLDGEHAALRPALVLSLVRVVEHVAGDDRSDVQVLPELLRGVHSAVDDRPGCGRAVRLVSDEMHRRRVRRHRGQRDDQIAELMVRLKATAGADADQLLTAELDQLLEDDRRARAAHPGALHGNRLALVGAGVAEQAALAVALNGVLEIGLGDVLGAQRVA